MKHGLNVVLATLAACGAAWAVLAVPAWLHSGGAGLAEISVLAPLFLVVGLLSQAASESAAATQSSPVAGALARLAVGSLLRTGLSLGVIIWANGGAADAVAEPLIVSGALVFYLFLLGAEIWWMAQSNPQQGERRGDAALLATTGAGQ